MISLLYLSCKRVVSAGFLLPFPAFLTGFAATFGSSTFTSSTFTSSAFGAAGFLAGAFAAGAFVAVFLTAADSAAGFLVSAILYLLVKL